VVKKAQKNSIASSALITVFIVIMLIISGPAQAVSVMISGLDGTYTKGNSINFTVSVNITDPDKYVPAANISLDVAGPVNLKRTFALDGTPISGDSAITITSVNTPQSNQFGYGYGYGVDSRSGTGSSFGYGYGYGYGYGAGGGTVTYTYNVTINTASLPAGSYNAVANLNTGKAAKPAFTSAPATFTISAATIQVTIEVNQKPVNPKSNEEITVTIYSNTSAGFNTDNVDISTVRFGPKGAAPFWSDPADKKLMLKFHTKDTGIQCGDTQATLTGKTNNGQDIIGSDSFETAGCGGGASGGNNGGSSGGGGVISSESYENVAKAETVDRDLRADKAVKYTYTTLGLYEIDATGSDNEDGISIRVEELKGTSKLVKESAPGNVYKNFNIWAGTKKIKDARLRYKIENSWLQSNGLESSDLKILRWSENKWQLLDTAEIKNDGTYTFVEADTPGFSSFVLTGLKGGVLPTATPTVTQQSEETSTGTGTATITQTSTSEAPPVNLAAIMFVIVLIAIVAVVYFKRKEIFKK
jgi:PGF-pre-PGF domain-containing protein